MESDRDPSETPAAVARRPLWRTPTILAAGATILALSLGIRHGFGLFLQPMSIANGWGREEFLAATGRDYMELRGREIGRLVEAGGLVAERDRIRLAEDALFISDSVFADLV